jgi:hypothetical protein
MASSSHLSSIPVLVGPDGGGRPLERVELSSLSGSTFNEAWLQRLIDSNPACLPIDEIEPGLLPFLSVCRELPTPNGYIDNLLMTPTGDIAIVETKLYRNPQARREVLAQALDYATALFGMDYARFERSVLTAAHAPRAKPASLYAALANPEQPTEHDFVDAVVRNLRRGSIIIMIAGDGIRSETEILLSGLERYARFHFTLALVELAVFRLPEPGQFLVRPRTLARTETIKRYVYEIAQAGGTPGIAPTERTESIASETYWQALEASAPGVRAPLQRLIDDVAELGVYPEFRASLNLKWDRPELGKSINLGYIMKSGAFWFDLASWSTPQEAALAYIKHVTSIFGAELHQFPKSQTWTPYKDGKPIRVQHVLPQLPALKSAMEQFIAEIKKHDAAQP